MNSVSIRENIKNAFEVVRKTYESVDKLLAELDRQAVECGFVPVTPQFLRWKSDREYQGWFIQSFIKLYQRDSAPLCQSGNGLKNDPIYAVEISFEEEPRMTLCKYVYSTLEHWDKPPSVSEHWFFYWPLYDGDNFSDYELGNGIGRTVPNNEKASEKYGKIQEVIWKEIDLLSITSTNIRDMVFRELKRLGRINSNWGNKSNLWTQGEAVHGDQNRKIPVRVARFQAQELEKWRNGERENGKDFYCRKLPGTKGFGYLGVLKQAGRASLPFHIAFGEDVASPVFYRESQRASY